MSDISRVQPLTVEESANSAVSWPAVIAGATASLALTLVLLAFGTGLGVSSVSPWSGSGVSATTFKIGTGLYLIVMAMLSSAIGGYLAGRLRSRWTGAHTDEIYFRDTAHGFLAWALASIVGAAMLVSPLASTISSVAGGAAQGAAAGAAQSSASEGYLDQLLRPTTPSNDANNQGRAEVGRLFSSSLKSGEIKPADKEYVAKVVAARTGLNQQEATKRVDDVIVQAKSDVDAARKATASLAFWLTASLLIGALSAALAATEGGGLRDETWTRRKA